MDGELNLIEVELREVQMREDAGGSQIIILGEKDGEREFPIFIGYTEALALDLALHGFNNPRPMTHDLILNVAVGLGAELRRVIVDDLRQDTFFGKLAFQTAAGTEELIDSRPSDAIVLATKRRVPIFVAEHVLEIVSRNQEEGEA
jgi:bifunctional DNase/RNase